MSNHFRPRPLSMSIRSLASNQLAIAVVAVIAFTPLPAMALLLGGYIVVGPAELLARRLRHRTTAQPAAQIQVTSAVIPPENPERS